MGRPSNVSKENVSENLIAAFELETNVDSVEVNKKTDTDNDILKRLEELEKSLITKDKIISKQNSIIETMATNKNSGEPKDITNELLQVIKQMQSENNKSKSRDVVKVIFLDEVAQAQFKLQNGTIFTFKDYGEVCPVSIMEAEMLLNQYVETFKRGALTFDTDHVYLMREKGIDVDKINYKPLESIKNMHTLADKELKELFKGLSYYQREMFKSHIIKKLAQNEINYMSIAKIRMLNKFAKTIYNSPKGGFEYILEKLEEVGVEE